MSVQNILGLSKGADHVLRLQSLFISSSDSIVAFQPPIFMDAAMYAAKRTISFGKQMAFALFALLIITIAASLCIAVKPSPSPITLTLLPPPKKISAKADLLALSESVTTPQQQLPQQSRQSQQHSYGTVEPIPFKLACSKNRRPSTTTSTPALTLEPFASLPSVASLSAPTSPVPHVDVVIDSLSLLSVSRPDVESAVDALDHLSISESKVVNAFSNITISSSHPSPSSSLLGPLPAKEVEVSLPTLQASTLSSHRNLAVDHDVDVDLDSKFAALSLKPLVKSIKSCLKKGPSSHAKKVHFMNPTMTLTEVREYFVDGKFTRSVRSDIHTPHSRAQRFYRLAPDNRLFMYRQDGVYHTPFRKGIYGTNLYFRHIVQRFPRKDEKGDVVQKRCCGSD